MKNNTKDLRRIATAVEAIQQGNTARDTSKPTSDKLPLMGALIMAIGGGEKRTRKHTAMVRTFPIRAYVGPNGGGKSLAAVLHLLPSLRAGRTVISTVKLLDHRTGEPHRAYEEFYDFDQLVTVNHADVFADEVTGVANSRSSSSMSPRVQNRLVQMRRVDSTFSWSAPNWARGDKIVREVTQAVTECRGYFPGRANVSGSGVGQWAPKRMFRFRTFDTMDFEEWSAGKRDKLEPVASSWFKGIGSQAFDSYDTMDAVSTVANASESGLCDVCDKPVRKETCSCKRVDGKKVGEIPDEVLFHHEHEHAPSVDEALELADRSHFAGEPMLVTAGDGSVVV